jgi:peptide/nickel transport system ATP-binding protein
MKGEPMTTTPRTGRQAPSTPPSATDAAPGVEIRDLTVAYAVNQTLLPAVHHVSLTLEPGTITGLVGESGSGKSTLAMATVNAVQPPGRITEGSIDIEGIGDVLTFDRKRLNTIRGAQIGYVFQAAQNSLNPLEKIGRQVLDLGRSHKVGDLKELLHFFSDILTHMGLPAKRILTSYQHQLSGGMRQRVEIAFALVLRPHVLVLDEPTTALDMITQANILDIIRSVHRSQGLTTLLVTHDIGVVADIADRIAVLYGGHLVEVGDTVEILQHPAHPYTRGLIQALPRLTGDIAAARPLAGRPPTLTTIARKGCIFRDRCPIFLRDHPARCEEQTPPMREHGSSSGLAACHFIGTEDGSAVTAVATVHDSTAGGTGFRRIPPSPAVQGHPHD